ncbi:MAG TPA: hypothetical protein VFS21_11840 [Roseiflexaceae bacterium]|nr:hypothetical protein [Roseiflexaceae bacterium]
MITALTATHHDPDGRLYAQTARALPQLLHIFGRVAVQLTRTTVPESAALLREAGVLVGVEPEGRPGGVAHLGWARRDALALGLRLETPCVVLCDFDRALHWAERFPEELAAVAAAASAHDCTVLGRTPRAFASHPQVQVATEAAVNRAFAALCGHDWDITAAARALSRRAAAAILDGCPETSIGTDAAWPLFLLRAGGFSLGYRATEGLEFETPDRYPAEIAAAGGLDSWLAAHDRSVDRWLERLEVARLEIVAMREGTRTA